MELYVNKVRKAVAPYYATNDTAHQLDHADHVYEVACEIAKAQHLAIPHHLIVLACYMHDIHADQREDHHEAAHDHVLATENALFTSLSSWERNIVAMACLEHRASWNGEYTSGLSELVSAADRGRPGELDAYIERSFKYAKDKLGATEAEARVHSRVHVKEKYGRDGYAAFSPLYRRHYGKKLEELHSAIDAI